MSMLESSTQGLFAGEWGGCMLFVIRTARSCERGRGLMFLEEILVPCHGRGVWLAQPWFSVQAQQAAEGLTCITTS